MNVNAPATEINACIRITPARQAVKRADSKTAHGKDAARSTAVMANETFFYGAGLFHCETRLSSAFAAQAIAQALSLGRATSLEAARRYQTDESPRPRLIRFA